MPLLAIPQEIWYTSAWLCQYVVPEVPLLDEALRFLADFPDDEVH